MRKILEDLYYGNITPNAKTFSKNTDFAKAADLESAKFDTEK